MTYTDANSSMAAPGFAGFVPSLKYQFGKTYGHAVSHILKTDPSLKQGFIQQERLKKVREILKKNQEKLDQEAAEREQKEKQHSWKTKHATGDDRFSFPPVPGYTGYIPRSQEHYGRPYVETTSASLESFKKEMKARDELPPCIQAIKESVIPVLPPAEPLAHEKKFVSVNAPVTDISPYQLSGEHPLKTFIGGYTGFVPRLQNHFGEPYSKSVRKAIGEFTTLPIHHVPLEPTSKMVHHKVKATINPIPGFTGFIPGSRTCFATTFGRTASSAYDKFNGRDEKGRTNEAVSIPSKHLSKSLPVPGYKGHIPGIIFAAERSYGLVSKECIQEFAKSHSA